MKIFKFLIFNFILIVSFANCSMPTTKDDKNCLENLNKLAKKKFNNNYNFQFNKDSSFVLVVVNKKKHKKLPFHSVRFFIYDVEESKIIYEDILSNGNVKWIDNSKVEIKKIPGIIKNNQTLNDYVFIYDIKRKILYNKNNIIRKR